MVLQVIMSVTEMEVGRRSLWTHNCQTCSQGLLRSFRVEGACMLRLRCMSDPLLSHYELKSPRHHCWTFLGRLSKNQAPRQPPKDSSLPKPDGTASWQPWQGYEARSAGRPRGRSANASASGIGSKKDTSLSLNSPELPTLLASAAWAFGHVRHHHKVRFEGPLLLY